jgi:hypothetical protein
LPGFGKARKGMAELWNHCGACGYSIHTEYSSYEIEMLSVRYLN